MPNHYEHMEAALKLFLESMKTYPNDELTHAGAYRVGWRDCVNMVVEKIAQPALGGTWTKMHKWEHVCATPNLASAKHAGARNGDVWTCNVCDTSYVITFNSDMRGEEWVEWKNVGHAE